MAPLDLCPLGPSVIIFVFLEIQKWLPQLWIHLPRPKVVCFFINKPGTFFTSKNVCKNKNIELVVTRQKGVLFGTWFHAAAAVYISAFSPGPDSLYWDWKWQFLFNKCKLVLHCRVTSRAANGVPQTSSLLNAFENVEHMLTVRKKTVKPKHQKDLGNEREVGVVRVLRQLGRRKDPLSLLPPQGLCLLRSRLGAERLKANSTCTLEFALMEIVLLLCSDTEMKGND